MNKYTIVNPFCKYYDETFKTGGYPPNATRSSETIYQIMKSLALKKSNHLTKKCKKDKTNHCNEKIIIPTYFGNCEILPESNTLDNQKMLCGLTYIDIACVAGLTAYDILMMLMYCEKYNTVYYCSACCSAQQSQHK